MGATGSDLLLTSKGAEGGLCTGRCRRPGDGLSSRPNLGGMAAGDRSQPVQVAGPAGLGLQGAGVSEE